MLEYGGAIGAQTLPLRRRLPELDRQETAAPPVAPRAPAPAPDSDFMLGGAVTSVVLSKTLPPRYIAVAQIYLHPRGLPGAERDPSSARDSTGYTKLVESQARIFSSQLVLDRVTAAEALDKDPEFVPKGFSLFGSLFWERSKPPEKQPAQPCAH